MIINTIILLSPLTIPSRDILLRERIFPKKRNSRVLFPYFPQKIIVIYRFKSMKFRSHRVRFLIKRLSLPSSLPYRRKTPLVFILTIERYFPPGPQDRFSRMLMNNSSDRYKSGQMIPSRRLRSCLRCRNVSKDELREGISWMGEVHLFHRSFIVEMKREGIERVVSRRDIFGLSPSEGWFFYILIPRGTCSWHICDFWRRYFWK